MSNLYQRLETVAQLSEESRGGLDYELQPIPSETEVVQVNIKDKEELPIFVTASDTQLLCICYLWGEDEIKAEQRPLLYEAMLEANIPMPLSSFAKIDDKYAIFGALALTSSAEDLALELSTLSDNAIDAIDAMSDFLK